MRHMVLRAVLSSTCLPKIDDLSAMVVAMLISKLCYLGLRTTRPVEPACMQRLCNKLATELNLTPPKPVGTTALQGCALAPKPTSLTLSPSLCSHF